MATAPGEDSDDSSQSDFFPVIASCTLVEEEDDDSEDGVRADPVVLTDAKEEAGDWRSAIGKADTTTLTITSLLTRVGMQWMEQSLREECGIDDVASVVAMGRDQWHELLLEYGATDSDALKLDTVVFGGGTSSRSEAAKDEGKQQEQQNNAAPAAAHGDDNDEDEHKAPPASPPAPAPKLCVDSDGPLPAPSIPIVQVGGGQIPRLAVDDPRVAELIQQGQPVVITGTNLVRVATAKWSSLDYLRERANPAFGFAVYSSRAFFQYSDLSNNAGGFAFRSAVNKEKMSMAEFCDLLAAAEQVQQAVRGGGSGGDGVDAAADAAAAAAAAADADGGGGAAAAAAAAATAAPSTSSSTASCASSSMPPVLYLQQSLTRGIGDALEEDFHKGFNWPWLAEMKQILRFGGLTTNLLLIGQDGCVTPVHYDEQENFFAQAAGWKRVVLFAPDQFPNLYNFPLFHPADRQSQLDLYDPDLARFPRAAAALASGVEAVLGPGDVCYIPEYWYHHIEAPYGPNTSINFWFSTSKNQPPFPGTAAARELKQQESGAAAAAGAAVGGPPPPPPMTSKNSKEKRQEEEIGNLACTAAQRLALYRWTEKAARRLLGDNAAASTEFFRQLERTLRPAEKRTKKSDGGGGSSACALGGEDSDEKREQEEKGRQMIKGRQEQQPELTPKHAGLKLKLEQLLLETGFLEDKEGAAEAFFRDLVGGRFEHLPRVPGWTEEAGAGGRLQADARAFLQQQGTFNDLF